MMRRFNIGDTVYFGSLIGKVVGLIGSPLPMDANGVILLPPRPSEVRTPAKYEVQFKSGRRMRLFVEDLSRIAPGPIVTKRIA